MKDFKLDKTVFKAQSFEGVQPKKHFYQKVCLCQLLQMAFHLTCRIYGIKDGDSLKLDRTVFSARKF